MKKRVLLAIDLDQPATWAASYAVQLAARLQLSLVLMAIFPTRAAVRGRAADLPREKLQEGHRQWLGKVRERCQQEGVPLEIFISSGPFGDEVRRFAQAQSSLQFIILGLPGETLPGTQDDWSMALRSLKEQFEGEVLLVRGQGKVTRFLDR